MKPMFTKRTLSALENLTFVKGWTSVGFNLIEGLVQDGADCQNDVIHSVVPMNPELKVVDYENSITDELLETLKNQPVQALQNSQLYVDPYLGHYYIKNLGAQRWENLTTGDYLGNSLSSGKLLRPDLMLLTIDEIEEIIVQRSVKKTLPVTDAVPSVVRQAAEIADAGLAHIRDRAATYDQADGERSAGKVAVAFNAITGKDLKESEVWLILQLVKDVRQFSNPAYHQDSAEDCIAYAALKAEALENRS